MKNIITLPGWGFSKSSLKDIWPNSISLTCEDLFNEDSISPMFALKDAVDSFNKKPCTMIGWSLGGLLALDYCAIHGDHKPNLILLSPTTNFKYENEENFEDLSELQTNMGFDRAKTLNRFYLNLLGTNTKDRTEIFNSINKYRSDSEELSTSALQHALNYLKVRNISEKIEGLKNSCLIIHGEKDNLIPLEHSKLILKALPNSTLKIIPNASHMLPYENKVEIVDLVNKHALAHN